MNQTAPDLRSLVILLQPQEGQNMSRQFPTWWGHAALEMFLRTVTVFDQSLGHKLGKGEHVSPFTLSTLLASPDRVVDFPPVSSDLYLLRITTLNAALSDILWRAVQPGSLLGPGSLVEIDRFIFKIQAALTEPEDLKSVNQDLNKDIPKAWLSSQTCAALKTNAAEMKHDKARLGFDLISPTCFKINDRPAGSKARFMPLPLPRYVFLNLLNQWESTVAEAYKYKLGKKESIRLANDIQRSAVVTSFKIRSSLARGIKGGSRTGAVGKIKYEVFGCSAEQLEMLYVLSEFALFSGIGVNTTMGLGQVRAVLY
jgi:CRISPR-associated endoribonuclease Cas6